MRIIVKSFFIPFLVFLGLGFALYFIIQTLNLSDFLHIKFLGINLHNAFFVWGMLSIVGSLVISGVPNSSEYDIFKAIDYWWNKITWWAKIIIVLSCFSIAFTFYVFISKWLLGG